MATPNPDAMHNLKPGSSRADAAALSSTKDFGIAEDNVAERTYTSENTKQADHGATQPMDYEHQKRRDHGVGGRDSGPGSASGGDLDPSFVGIGGSSLAQDIDNPSAAETDVNPANGAVDAHGPDKSYSDGSSDSAASGGHAQGENQTDVGKVGGPHPQINVVTPSDERTTNTGADQVSHRDAADIDDSFRGEISSSEASGRDDLGR